MTMTTFHQARVATRTSRMPFHLGHCHEATARRGSLLIFSKHVADLSSKGPRGSAALRLGVDRGCATGDRVQPAPPVYDPAPQRPACSAEPRGLTPLICAGVPARGVRGASCRGIGV